MVGLAFAGTTHSKQVGTEMKKKKSYGQDAFADEFSDNATRGSKIRFNDSFL